MNGMAERDAGTGESANIPGGAEAPSKAREILTELVGDRTPAGTLHDLHLLTTEIVTNAVRHAEVDESATLELRVVATPPVVRVSVTDPGGDSLPRMQEVDVMVPGGMGLFIVEQVSDRWGFERSDDGSTEVWFELGQAS
jgi:anti-sigma regulatory factor (Ser/Thr protein kinase)